MHASSEREIETKPAAALDRGEYFGTAAGAPGAGAVTLTLTDYAPGTLVPSHAHAHPYFCYVSAGGFEELGERGSYVATRGTLVFHPAAETHSDEFGESGGRCFNTRRATLGPRRAVTSNFFPSCSLYEMKKF